VKADEFRLTRFLDAQEHSYATAIEELRSGEKRTHWIWFVFPQLRGLGRSAASEEYGLSGLAEARAYLADPLLGRRLRESTQTMLTHRSLGASAVLGELDALKFRSCLTLFSMADPAEQLFATALESFFAGERDVRTLKLLEAQGEA
jgi:uncharacterized protein (DUF1810 family)